MDVIRLYLESPLDHTLTVFNGENDEGDITFILDTVLPVGSEGYLIKISDKAEVRAVSPVGAVYAAATLSQMLTEGAGLLQKGEIRDYPQYPVRGFMIDTARYFVGLEYLEEITEYAAFFKVNEIHLHLNDGAGETVNSFRLESENYPVLNESIVKTCRNPENKIYRKSDFRRYQKNAAVRGISVVPEIDAPSHCGTIVCASKSEESAKRGFKNVGINEWQLDLRDEAFENSLSFVQSIFDEYTEGGDPVFAGNSIHIGTDEWIRDNDLEKFGLTSADRNEQMRKYMDAMIRYIDLKGYTPVMWNGLNKEGKEYGGKTPVSNKCLLQFWSPHFGDMDIVKQGKYKIINSFDSDMYIVPGVNYYKNEFDLRSMYENWRVGHLGYVTDLPEGYPLLEGAETAIWLDANCALSHTDLFRLLKSQIMLISEKAWCADENRNSAEEFISRVSLLANSAPGANPGRYTKAEKRECIAAYDFSCIDSGTVQDSSGNGFGARVCGSCRPVGGSLKIDGGFISLPLKEASERYKVELEILISSNTPDGAELFSGADGVMYVSQGKLFYSRKGYTYLFDINLPLDRKILLIFEGEYEKASVSIDSGESILGKFIYGEYENEPGKRAFTTFRIPFEKIGSGINGEIFSLAVYEK